MPYSLSVWLDDWTAQKLDKLCRAEDRKRSAMVKVLIRRAARESKLESTKGDNPRLKPSQIKGVENGSVT